MASNKIDESTRLTSAPDAASSLTKTPSYQTIETQSSTVIADSTEDEETGYTPSDLVNGVTHNNNDLTGSIKSVISVLLLGIALLYTQDTIIHVNLYWCVAGEFIANTDTTLIFASARKISSKFASLKDAD